MKFFKNVLSPETCNDTLKEVQEKLHKDCWLVSSLCWQKEVRQGIQGASYQTFVSESLHKRIKSEIGGVLPPHENLVIQHYIWDCNSGIAYHNDFAHRFGATIYLNNEWHINQGGLFVYQQNNEHKVYVPEFNSMVLNDDKSWHLVTPVSVYAGKFRTTLQIWGK